MNAIFKLLAFTIMLNFAIGITLEVIPIFKDDPSTRGGVPTYNDTYATGFNTNLQKEVNPSGDLEDTGDAIYRVLDMVTLGFVKRLVDTVTQYTHGFVVLLDNLFGSYLQPSTYTILFGKPFGIFYSLITFLYIVCAIKLWTEKDITS